MFGPLHLVKVPLRADKLVSIARHRRLPLRDLDDGYVCHCLVREIWQQGAPTPFVLRRNGRLLHLWGYSASSADVLVEHARTFGDPALLVAVDHLEDITSRQMPPFNPGRRLGFVLRACPIVRLSRGSNGHRAGAEVDAFLARCFAAGRDVVISRQQVYCDWISAQVNRPEATGVRLDWARVSGMGRERLVRRTQGADRAARRLERPDVRFEGELVVVSSEKFQQWLARGVGRHRAFGFGAVMLVPPQTRAAAST